jgi:hypothetical protein
MTPWRPDRRPAGGVFGWALVQSIRGPAGEHLIRASIS